MRCCWPVDQMENQTRRRYRMNWKFWQREKRDSGGDFNDAVLRAIEAQAAGTAADAGSTAAVEAASSWLSRALSSAEVQGADYAVEAITPTFLSQVGRDLIRRPGSMHVIRMDGTGRVKLIPASSWHFEGNHDPDSWRVRVTAYGPSTSTTWNLPASGVVFVRWGSTPGQPYVGTSPLSWAHTTARLQSEVERSLADESAGPLAQIIPIPQDGGDGGEDDPLKMLKLDITGARGKAVLTETTVAGFGEGMSVAPRRDWVASRLGPNFPASMATVQEKSFMAVLAACGLSVALFDDSDGTSKREQLRQVHMNTVLPLVRQLEHELTMKLETPVKLVFDKYALDMVSRAQVVDKLVRAGVDTTTAMMAVGLDE